MDGFSENVIKKIMPHDDDAERAVLTSMLMSSKAIAEAQEIIKLGDEFYNRVYGIIYDTIVEMENNGLKVDPVTLKDKLGEKELPPEVANLSYLMEIMKGRKPASLALCTLLDKPSRRVTEVAVDYTGFTIKKRNRHYSGEQ